MQGISVFSRRWENARGPGVPLLHRERVQVRIEQLMTKATKCCQVGQRLSEVAELMRVSDCGCLPVTPDDGSQRLLGIITDRDICMAVRSGGNAPGGFRVGDVMTEGVRACNPGDPVSEAIAIMGEARVRRLPVVDDSDRVVGLLSLADLAQEAVRQATWKEPEIAMAEVGGLLAAICQPRDYAIHWPDGSTEKNPKRNTKC